MQQINWNTLHLNTSTHLVGFFCLQWKPCLEGVCMLSNLFVIYLLSTSWIAASKSISSKSFRSDRSSINLITSSVFISSRKFNSNVTGRSCIPSLTSDSLLHVYQHISYMWRLMQTIYTYFSYCEHICDFID